MDKCKYVWQSRYFAIPRIYMSFLGLWPYCSIYSRYLLFMVMFPLACSIFIPELLYLLKIETVYNTFMHVPHISITTVMIFRFIYLMMNNTKINTCFSMIEKDWSSLNTDIEKAILQRYNAYGHRLNLIFAGIYQFTSLTIIIRSVAMTLLENTSDTTSQKSKLPLYVEYGEKLRQYPNLITIHCNLNIFLQGSVSIAVDTLFIALIQHVCGMFAVIGYVLEHIGKDNDINFISKTNKVNDDYNTALNCLRTHLRVIELAVHLESMFTSMFLCNMISNLICTSILGLQVVTNLNNFKDMIQPLVVALAGTARLFFQCWQGQRLLTYSAIPYKSICRSNWYYTSIKCRKILLLILTRSMFLCKITAGKFIILSIESFGEILKTSISFFTVLRSTQ